MNKANVSEINSLNICVSCTEVRFIQSQRATCFFFFHVCFSSDAITSL